MNRATPIEIECPYCRKKFKTVKNAQKYCSEKCQRAFNTKGMQKAFTCSWCGVLFDAERRRKYCSELCRLKANGRRQTVPKAPQKIVLSAAQINKLARECGLTYGQYVAKYNC